MKLYKGDYMEHITELIGKIYRNMKGLLTSNLQESEIPLSEFYYLFHIAKQEGITLSELSDKVSIGKPTITKMVKRLIDKDLVYKQKQDRDNRFMYLYLTDKGRLELPLINKSIDKLRGNINNTLTEEENVQLKYLLSKVLEGIISERSKNKLNLVKL